MGKLAQRVVDGQDRSAGIAEDGGDALAGEGGPEDTWLTSSVSLRLGMSK
jgi:hypothetical protein